MLKKKIVIVVCIIVAVAAIGYGGVYYYQRHFSPARIGETCKAEAGPSEYACDEIFLTGVQNREQVNEIISEYNLKENDNNKGLNAMQMYVLDSKKAMSYSELKQLTDEIKSKYQIGAGLNYVSESQAQ